MNITENDRNMVRKCLEVDLPESLDDIRGLSWSALRELRDRLSDAADRLCSGDRDLDPDQKIAVDKTIEVIRAVRDEIEDRTAEGRKEPARIDEPMRPQPNNQKGRNEMKNAFAPKKRWADIFGREPRAFEGVKNFGEAICALHRGDTEKIRELRTLNAVTGSEGGFAVPEIWWSQVYDSGVEKSVALDRVQTFPMTSDVLYVPAWDSADHTTGPIGAVEGSWLGELQTATRVTPNLRLIKFNAYKLAMFLACSSEILSDSSALAASIGPLMRNSLAFSLDEAILTGDGAGKPQGVLNSPATILSARATAGNLAFADLVGMVGRMLPSSLSQAVWIVSPSAFAVLAGLVITAGTGNLVMQYGNGAADLAMRILGHDVRISEKLPELGDAGDVMLVDLSYYGLAMRETARFEKTNAVQFLQDAWDMRFVMRVDGHPLIAKPFTPAGGGNTLSPFVVLDA